MTIWEPIHPEIIKASQEIAIAGKYDDAIFAAFRIVEAMLQERIASKSIGEALIVEAFEGDPPQVNISSDPRDRRGIRDLFAGALSNIRNDRGHKKTPLTPCESINDCVLYLAVASFLINLLAKDKNTFPRIDSVRILGTAEDPRAELRGINFAGSRVAVVAGGAQISIVRKAPTVLEIVLPRNFFGNISVVADGKRSGESFCDVSSLGKEPESYLEVIAAELPLYSDAKAHKKRPEVVGILLRSIDSSRESIIISPTYPGRYEAGHYVTHGPYEHGTSVGETWFADPTTGSIEYAWTGSMIATPNMVGAVGTFRLGGISILPTSVHTQVGENRRLRVSGWGRDGPVQKELDVTGRVRWKTSDSSVAFVKEGVVIPKGLGRARAECELDGFVASVELSVEHLLKGQRTTYFQGLRRLQQIRFDREDNLYISNQGPSVFRLDKTGAFAEVVRISSSPRGFPGIDCLCLDTDKNLYVNDVSKRSAFKFEWNGKAYENPIQIAGTLAGAKKGIAVANSGDVFVAVMGSPGQGWIVRREIDGKETSFPTKGMPIWLAAGPDGNIYVPIVASSSILIYQPDGALVGEIPHQFKDAGISDILVSADGAVYLGFFHAGRILRISYKTPLWHAELLPQHFGTPGGIAMDSRGRLYVSDSAGNSIDVVY